MAHESGGRRARTVAAVAVALATAVGGAMLASGAPPESALSGWPRQLGSTGGDSVTEVAVTSSGDVYVVGSVYGALPGATHHGLGDGFVARFDKAGRLRWLRQFGTSGIDLAEGLVVSGSSVYVGGRTNGAFPGFTNPGSYDGFVARFDTSGNQKWLRQFGTAALDVVMEVAASGSAVYVGGRTAGAFPGLTNQGSSDAFVARFDSSGNQKWIQQFGTTTLDEVHGLAASGNSVYIAGGTSAAMPGASAHGGTDGFLARFDGSGNQVWIRQIGTSALDFAQSTTVAGSSIYVSGTAGAALPGSTHLGNQDGFLARYDTSGNQVWIRQFGSPGADYAPGLAVRSGRVYVAGSTYGSVSGFALQGVTDGFAVRYDGAGNQVWIRQFGLPGADEVHGLAVRSSDSYGGAVVIGGFTDGTMWGQAKAGDYDGIVATMLS